MPDLDLTREQWEALASIRDAGIVDTRGVATEALNAVLAYRPAPVLEDGMYYDTDGDVVHVTDGKWHFSRNTSERHALPAEASGWTRLRVLADGEVAVTRYGLCLLLEHAEEETAPCWSCKESLKRLLLSDGAKED